MVRLFGICLGGQNKPKFPLLLVGVDGVHLLVPTYYSYICAVRCNVSLSLSKWLAIATIRTFKRGRTGLMLAIAHISENCSLDTSLHPYICFDEIIKQ